MVFEVGETVVYPHHGAAKIEEIKMRTIKGEEKMYLKLRVAQGDLTIEVPAENVDLVGVRDVVGKEGLEHVFDVLRAEFTEEPTNWSRRYKANLEKLASGDVNKWYWVEDFAWSPGRERWQIDLALPDSATTFEYAVVYRHGVVNGARTYDFWDNNYGANYKVEEVVPGPE